MDILKPRTAVIGFGEDGSEAIRQLINDGLADTYFTDLENMVFKSKLGIPGTIILVLILGTVGMTDDSRKHFNSTLSMLSNRTLNITVITTMGNDEIDKHANPNIPQELLMAPVDACFIQYMRTRLFNADGGRARINALSNAARIIIEMITITDAIRISLDEFRETLSRAGRLWLSSGKGSGNDRAIKAVNSALTDPFTGKQLAGGKKILTIIGGDDLRLGEVNKILDITESALHMDNKDIVFGVARKSIPDPVIKVLILATHYS